MDIIQHLIDHDVKPSLQRIAIMKYLLEHKCHPTADMIYLDLYKEIPTLSKTTVYNTLNLLTEQGAIRKIGIDEKNARFDGDLSPHAHFRCKDCGCIYDLPLNYADTIEVAGYGKFEIDEIHLYYKGLCESCLKKRQTI